MLNGRALLDVRPQDEISSPVRCQKSSILINSLRGWEEHLKVAFTHQLLFVVCQYLKVLIHHADVATVAHTSKGCSPAVFIILFVGSLECWIPRVFQKWLWWLDLVGNKRSSAIRTATLVGVGGTTTILATRLLHYSHKMAQVIGK